MQLNSSCEATHFVPEKWLFKRGDLSSGIKFNKFMFRFTLSSGLSSGWPQKRGSTVISNALPKEDYRKPPWSLMHSTKCSNKKIKSECIIIHVLYKPKPTDLQCHVKGYFV